LLRIGRRILHVGVDAQIDTGIQIGIVVHTHIGIGIHAGGERRVWACLAPGRQTGLRAP